MAAERRANGGAAGPAVPPRAAPWEQVFRRTEVPLFVEDIARARASIREVAAAVGTDGLRGWLDAHPDFIGRIIAEVQVIDVNDAGFSTAQLPAASDGPSFHAAMMNGKFQGMIPVHTPWGS